jgi:hypothetical protein
VLKYDIESEGFNESAAANSVNPCDSLSYFCLFLLQDPHDDGPEVHVCLWAADAQALAGRWRWRCGQFSAALRAETPFHLPMSFGAIEHRHPSNVKRKT